MTLTQAIAEAIKDYQENGELTPTNPAIVKDGDDYYYSSSLHPYDAMVWDLQEGLGNWTPDADDDAEDVAAFIAANEDFRVTDEDDLWPCI